MLTLCCKLVMYADGTIFILQLKPYVSQCPVEVNKTTGSTEASKWRSWKKYVPSLHELKQCVLRNSYSLSLILFVFSMTSCKLSQLLGYDTYKDCFRAVDPNQFLIIRLNECFPRSTDVLKKNSPVCIIVGQCQKI